MFVSSKRGVGGESPFMDSEAGGHRTNGGGTLSSRDLRSRVAGSESVRDHGLRAAGQTTGRIQTANTPEAMMSRSNFPEGWDEARVRKLLEHYEHQTEDEAVAEDEAAYEDRKESLVGVPVELVPAVRELIAKHKR